MSLKALRKVPSPVRALSALVIAIVFALVTACGSTAGASTSAGTGATPSVAPDGGQGAAAPIAVVNSTGCNAAKATYTADTTEGATVKGGMGSNLNPTIDEILATLAAQQPPIGSSSAIASLLPVQGTPGAICANGDVYQDGRKVATDAVLIDRTPSASIVHVDNREFYLTPASEALPAAKITACPALVWTAGVGTPVQILKAVCLDNNDVVFSSKAVV